MKILFIKDVGGVGQRGTVKEVSDGYALNYLIPNGLAVQATVEKVREHDALAQKDSAQKAQKDAEILKVIRSLEGARIEIAARSTEKGGLFKSITAADVMAALQSRTGGILSADAIMLDHPIKTVGEHPVVIQWGKATAHVTLAIVSK